jgi:DNA end-binding protein Ku
MLPVKLYPATTSRRVRFHEFDGSGRRIRHRRVIEEPAAFGFGFDEAPIVAPVPRDDAAEPPSRRWEEPPGEALSRGEEPVAYEDVMLGYEIAPGETVLLSREEIRALAPERTRTIEIEDFVDLTSIDPIHFEKSYIAVPQRDAGAERAYVLLARAMDEAGMVGVGRIVLRTREHLAAIRPKGGAIVLETLFHGDEIRDAKELVAPGTLSVEEPSSREITMATQLIELLRVDWDPARYTDRGRERLLDAIAAKAKDAGTVSQADVEPAAEVTDLMEALRASVEAAKVRAAEERAG